MFSGIENALRFIFQFICMQTFQLRELQPDGTLAHLHQIHTPLHSIQLVVVGDDNNNKVPGTLGCVVGPGLKNLYIFQTIPLNYCDFGEMVITLVLKFRLSSLLTHHWVE